MPKLLIAYATVEGQAEKIAEHIGRRIEAQDWSAEIRNAETLASRTDLAPFDAVLLVASVHAGRHERAAARFVRENLSALNAKPNAFVSVSLSAAGNEAERVAAQKIADDFLGRVGWRPRATHIAAGAFHWGRYGVLKGWLMRRIARAKDIPTDQDREFTDWPDLDRFVDGFLAEARVGAGASGAAKS